MSTIFQTFSEHFHLPAGKVLSIVADANSTGQVHRLRAPGAGDAYPGVFAVATDATTVLGPFTIGASLVVECLTGFVVASVGDQSSILTASDPAVTLDSAAIAPGDADQVLTTVDGVVGWADLP